MKKIVNLNDLMIEQLAAMYQGELLLGKNLKEMTTHITDRNLKDLLLNYKEQNNEQLLRIKRTFNFLFTSKRGEHCKAIEIMIDEARDLIKRSADPQVRDAAIVTAMQHILHYQIAGYGAICTYAKTDKLYSVAELMHQNLEEEKKFDRKLAIIAEESINLKAQEVELK